MKHISRILFLLWTLASTAAKFLRASEANQQIGSSNNNGIPVHHASINSATVRRLFDDTQPIPVAIHPFTLTIRPTPQPLQQFQIGEIEETIENLVLTKLKNGATYESFNLAESIELNGEPDVVHTPSEAINEWMTRSSSSTLDYTSGGIAQMTFSVLGDVPSAEDLSDAILEILQRDLVSSLQANVDGLEWITTLTVEMDAPPTVSPTKAPTISATKSPTREPTQSPTKSPTTSPTVRPTISVFEKDPTAKPTPSPTPEPQDTSRPTEESKVVDNNDQEEEEEIPVDNSNQNGEKDDTYPYDDDIPAESRTFLAIAGGISAAGVIIFAAALFKRRRDRSVQHLPPLGARMVVGKGDGPGFVDDRFGDGDSTRTPDTFEGKMLANDTYGSPSSQSFNITSLRKIEPGDTSTPPRSDNTGEILQDIDWFGCLPCQNAPSLYFPIHLEAHAEKDEISGFEDNPSDNASASASANAVTPLPKEESFELTKFVDMDPIQKEAISSPSAVIPTHSVYDSSDVEERKSCLEPSAFATAALLDAVDGPSEKPKALVLEEERTPPSDGEDTPKIEGANENEQDCQQNRESDQHQLQSENPTFGEISESQDDEDESEFLLDTSWDPDDADDALSFDEPQFEPTFVNDSTRMSVPDADDALSFDDPPFEPQDGFQYDDFLTDAERHIFS